MDETPPDLKRVLASVDELTAPIRDGLTRLSQRRLPEPVVDPELLRRVAELASAAHRHEDVTDSDSDGGSDAEQILRPAW